jgi:hypothetical protein
MEQLRSLRRGLIITWAASMVLLVLEAVAAALGAQLAVLLALLLHVPLMVFAAVLAGRLASRLKRSVVGWVLLTLSFLGFFVIILPFLGPADPARRRPVAWLPPRLKALKECSRCGREVPPDSRVGKTCPHCGAYWAREVAR